jgi:WD40 repeat protein
MAVHSSFSMFNGRSGSIVCLHELETGNKVHEEELLNAERVVFAPTGKHPYLAFRSIDGNAFVTDYDLANPKRWKDLRRFESRPYSVASLDLSRDGRYLLRGTWHDGNIEVAVWDTSDVKPFARIDGVAVGCLTPDGKRVFVAKGNDLILHDIADGKPKAVQTYNGHTSSITCVSCSRDGKLVAAGTTESSNAVRAWNIESGKALDHFARHTGNVTCVCFSPDGKRILSAGGGVLRISDVQTGDVVYETTAQSSAIMCAVFTPGGRHAVFGLNDGTIKMWRLPD